MERILKSILMQYLTLSRCLVTFTDDANSVNLQSGIPQVNLNWKDGNFSQIAHLFFSNFGCQDFIVKLTKPVSLFQHVELQMKLHKERFNKRKYIFIPAANATENVFDLFQTEEISYVSDVLVVYEEDKTGNKNYRAGHRGHYDYSLWTHKYVGAMGNNDPCMLDVWFESNFSFLYGNNLFPNKLTNQQNRVLKVAVFPYEPYAIVELQKDRTYKYMGSEMFTMLMFSQYHNMTLVPVINEFDYWGEIWDNWTGNGLMGNLAEDKADIGAAALYTWESSYKFLDLSKPTVRTGITCLVPAPKLAAGWLTPLYAYPGTTWLAVCVMFVVSVLSIYLFEIMQLLPDFENISSINDESNDSIKLKLFGKALMSVIKTFVMQSITANEMIKGQLGRYLMGLVFITVLILSATYQSGLATIMTLPRYENPINTVEEFVESGLFWGATQDAWIMSIQKAEDTKFKKIVSRFVATSEEKLRQLSSTGEFAFSVERLPRDNYAVGTYIKEDVIQNFHLMSEDLYWEQCVIMMRKSSILLPYVDTFVLKVFEADLISFWQNEAATKYMNQYVQKAVKYLYHHQKERGIVKLKVSHLAGAFGVLCAGNILALIIFVMELIYYRFSRPDY